MNKQKELKKVLEYILKTNNVPKEALMKTKRNKVFMFGKNLASNVSAHIEEVIIDIFPNNISTKEIMKIVQTERDSVNEFDITLRKTPDISKTSFFKNKEKVMFHLSITEKEIEIKERKTEASY